jgi:hypothetical protein
VGSAGRSPRSCWRDRAPHRPPHRDDGRRDQASGDLDDASADNLARCAAETLIATRSAAIDRACERLVG